MADKFSVDSVSTAGVKNLVNKITITKEQQQRIAENPNAVFDVVRENRQIDVEKPVNNFNLTSEEMEYIGNDPYKLFEVLQKKQQRELKAVATMQAKQGKPDFLPVISTIDDKRTPAEKIQETLTEYGITLDKEDLKQLRNAKLKNFVSWWFKPIIGKDIRNMREENAFENIEKARTSILEDLTQYFKNKYNVQLVMN